MNKESYQSLFDLIDRHSAIIKDHTNVDMKNELSELTNVGIELMLLKNLKHSNEQRERKAKEIRYRLLSVINTCFNKYEKFNIKY
jgi:hypothetical protein